MHNVNFLFLTFGPNLKNHSQAVLSILSILKATDNSNRTIKILVYTDEPQFYNVLKDCVEIRFTPKEKLNEWEGEVKFFWRVKIMAMLDSSMKDSGHLFYLDSDTFVFNDLNILFEKLDQNFCMMHLRENELSTDKASDKALMWNQIKYKNYSGITINEKSAMWNAGVVALSHEEKMKYLNLALSINDEMCNQGVTRRLIEQFSLSVALESSSKLIDAKDSIAHYWGNKDEWNDKIAYYFSFLFQSNLPIIELLKSFNKDEWLKLPIIRSKKSLNKKIVNFANSRFVDSTEYVKG